MKKWMWLAMICLVAPLAASAQEANPVVSSAREIFNRQAKYIVASAQQMPAAKYGYHPTAGQWTFGKIVSHVAEANNAVCAMLSDKPRPDAKVSPTDPKAKLLPPLEASFEFCSQALANLRDARLGDTITYFRGRKTPRARALVELTDDLEDHYSQMASYLRLNGMTPPSAQPMKK